MDRARVTLPFGVAAQRRSSIRLLVLSMAATIILAACSTGGPDAPASSRPNAPSATATTVRPSSTTTTQRPSVSAPGATIEASPSQSPTADVPATTRPAADCSGNDDNRDFFDQFAASVSWSVYCAVLPSGWVVDSGSYRLADGGVLDVTYRGPSGARLELHEGSFCTDGASACSNHDTWLGTVAFANRTAQLATIGDRLAAYAAPGAAPSWESLASGLDQATFTRFCAALGLVSD